LPSVLERAIRGLAPGEVSQVIQSSFGFHIFRLERRVQPRPYDERRAQLDEMRSNLIEELIARRNQEAVDRARERIVSSAGVRVLVSALGFTYTGQMRHN
jgi:parvulin-like peptidyl-prolyl isomerase